MSWQAGQYGKRGGAHLGAMHAAVLAASQKPLVEQAMAQVHQILAQVPGDIDWASFQAGVQAYLSASHTTRVEYPEISRVGRVILRDAGLDSRLRGNGATVVLVPSMVNRGYVLDLAEGHSLVAALKVAGFRVLLVDWGEPTEEILNMEQVVTAHLLPLLQIAKQQAGGPVGVVGYCMGGLLALAGSILAGPEVVRKLGLLAVPWDFSVTPSSGHMLMARPVMEPWLHSQKVIPAEVMQQYFWLLDPWSPVRRFMHYGQATESERVFLTVLEDWLNDGLALDAPIGEEILMGWYADNRAVKGEWKMAGQVISPATLKAPLWVALGQKDNLVPPGCALPLIAQSTGAQVVMVDAGHVGLMVGRRAAASVYAPLTGWLKG